MAIFNNYSQTIWIRYPEYKFLGSVSVAKEAAVETRYTNSSLLGVLSDVYMLSRCDYLVCTFSSNVCRLAYELMQSLHVDASKYFTSLDDIYFYSFWRPRHHEVALYSHNATRPDEISLEVGDVLRINDNRWDGYSHGINLRTQQTGLYPSFKTVAKTKILDLPVYKENWQVQATSNTILLIFTKNK